MINISEKYKSFLWIPPRTASTLASLIFSEEEFGFSFYDINKVKISENFVHTHYFNFFQGHEDYEFILTVRNPYSQYLSFIGYRTEKLESLEKRFQSKEHYDFINNLKKRLPNYIIRVENIYEDYCNIPCVNKSVINQTGELKKIIDSKPNSLKIKNNFTFNQSFIDSVYYNNSFLFDTFGYHKDSWKNLQTN